MPMRDDMSRMRVELFEIKRTGFVNSPDSRMNCSTSGEHERTVLTELKNRKHRYKQL